MFLRCLWLVILLAGLCAPATNAQGPCNIPSSCVLSAPLGSFTCINVINGDNFVNLINNGLLLPYSGAPVNAQNTPQKLIIRGLLTCNTTYMFAPGSELIFVDEASGIDVTGSGGNLTIQGSNLHGCQKVWRGLKMVGSSSGNQITTLRLMSTINDPQVIRDAIIGVNVEGGRFDCSGSTFQANAFSMRISGDVVSKGISANDFDGSEQLLQTVQLGGLSVNTPVNAVLVQDCNYLLFGKSLGVPNLIHDYIWPYTVGGVLSAPIGMNCVNSNVDIFGTRFENIFVTFPFEPAYGLTVSSNAGHTVRYTGAGKGTNNPIAFNRVGVGIYAQDANIVVENTRFFEGYEMMDLRMYTYPATVSIRNNLFESYFLSGVSFSGNAAFQNSNVQSNDFIDDSELEPLFFFTGHRAISIGAQQPVPYHGFLVQDNSITINQNAFEARGISMFNVENIQLLNNRINNRVNVDYTVQGIHLLNMATGSKLVDNILLDITNSEKSIGIDVTKSGQVLYCQNQINNFFVDVRFDGAECDGSTYYRNEHYTRHRGLSLLPGARIGEQREKHNTWPGTGGVWEAVYEGGGNGYLNSLFLVPEPTSTDAWPNPVSPQGWFQPLLNPTGEEIVCQIDPPQPRTTADEALLAAEFEAYKGYPATVWDASIWLFTRLAKHQELRPAGSAAASFYSDNLSGNIGNLSSWSTALISASVPGQTLATEWANNYIDLLTKMDEIKALELQYQQADEQTSIILQEQIGGKKAELQELKTIHIALIAQFESEKNIILNGILTGLSNMTTTLLWEQNLKTVLELQATRLIAGAIGWSPDQKATLTSIADQCRHEGGWGVDWARGALGQYHYDDDLMCPGEIGERGKTNLPDTKMVSLSPNPARDAVTVTWPDEWPVNKIVLKSVVGIPLPATIHYEGNNAYINIGADLPNGLYLVELFDEQESVLTIECLIIYK